MEMLSLKDAGTFHGHLGPYLTIGYMAGVFASEKLEQKTELPRSMGNGAKKNPIHLHS